MMPMRRARCDTFRGICASGARVDCCRNPGAERAAKSRRGEIAAPDLELLFVDGSAITHEMAVGRMLFARFDVRIEDTTLEATLWGEPVDVARHVPACEPRGATYAALRVARESEGWSAACVVDVWRG